MQTMPNFPPPSWQELLDKRPREKSVPPLRLVYVGAVSIRDTWIVEFLDWLDTQTPGKLQLDLYISTTDIETRTLLRTRPRSFIRVFSPGVSYDCLPDLLQSYDVGLILYKGTTENYVWNAPNKLFEYLSCGLEVWYPREMRGIPPALEEFGIECGVELDFSKLPQEAPTLRSLAETPALQERTPLPRNVNCVRVIQPMMQKLLFAFD
jgi:hypothetical protein